MDFEQERRIGAKRRLVIGEVGPVGRPHFDEPGPALLHDVGHPEAAADLHELAARQHDRAITGEGPQGQHDG